jgi:16S rRNA processing protein RimM
MHQHLRNIGKLVSVFGLKGELLLQHQLGKKTSLKGLQMIFLETRKEEWLPHFLEWTRIKNDMEVFLKLEGIDTKEKARALVHKEVWLSEDDFSKFAAKSAPISLVGYHIIDRDIDLGEVLEVIEQPHQVLCRLEINKKEVLVPVHDEFLKKIDRKTKAVHLMLPTGLLDVYLK